MSTDLELVDPPASTGLFKSDDPASIRAQAVLAARELAQVVKEQKLTTRISGRDHVRVEGWTFLGSLLGVFQIVVWSRPLTTPDHDNPVGWEARVEARTLDDRLVGAAEAECLRAEANWRNRDDYAIRSMAQTRAVSKALRLPLGFVMALAGYDPTPAEEIPQPVEVRAPIRVGPEYGNEEPPQDVITAVDPVGSSTDEPYPYSGMFQPPDDTTKDRTSLLPATKPQQGKIWALLGKLEDTGKPKYAKDSMRAGMGLEYGTEDPAELHRWQARELIDRLLKVCEKEGLEP